MGNKRYCTSSEIRSARSFGGTVKKVAALPPPFPPRPVLAKAGAVMTADVAAGFFQTTFSLSHISTGRLKSVTVGGIQFSVGTAHATRRLKSDWRLLRLWSVSAFFNLHKRQVFRAGVVRARTDDFAVFALFKDVCRPAGGARNHKQRREHGGRYAEFLVGHGGEPV